jgi:hypothetical protein
MDSFWIILVFAAFVAIGIAVAIGQHLQEQERQKQLHAVAETKGWRFSAEVNPTLLTTLGHFHLFSQGRSRRIVNVMRTDVEDIAVSIFDYRFTTGSGKQSHTHRQTVALFEAEQIRLPRFTLRPEGLFHKLGSFLGYQDIDFAGHPSFSDAYLLQGGDEARIREVFTDTVLSYYARRADLCTEGQGQQIVYYRADQQIAPGGIETFLKQGLDAVDLFCEKDDALRDGAQVADVREDDLQEDSVREDDAQEDTDLMDRFLVDAQAVLESLESTDGD